MAGAVAVRGPLCASAMQRGVDPVASTMATGIAQDRRARIRQISPTASPPDRHALRRTEGNYGDSLLELRITVTVYLTPEPCPQPPSQIEGLSKLSP